MFKLQMMPYIIGLSEEAGCVLIRQPITELDTQTAGT